MQTDEKHSRNLAHNPVLMDRLAALSKIGRSIHGKP